MGSKEPLAICLAGQYHAAESRLTQDGRAYLEPICNHNHTRKSAALACAERIAAGLPEPVHWRNIADDDLAAERNLAAGRIVIEFWQKLADRFDAPRPPSIPPATLPPARAQNRPRPVAELSAWQKSEDAAFYLERDDATGEFAYLRQDSEAVEIRAKYESRPPRQNEAPAGPREACRQKAGDSQCQ